MTSRGDRSKRPPERPSRRAASPPSARRCTSARSGSASLSRRSRRSARSAPPRSGQVAPASRNGRSVSGKPPCSPLMMARSVGSLTCISRFSTSRWVSDNFDAALLEASGRKQHRLRPEDRFQATSIEVVDHRIGLGPSLCVHHAEEIVGPVEAGGAAGDNTSVTFGLPAKRSAAAYRRSRRGYPIPPSRSTHSRSVRWRTTQPKRLTTPDIVSWRSRSSTSPSSRPHRVGDHMIWRSTSGRPSSIAASKFQSSVRLNSRPAAAMSRRDGRRAVRRAESQDRCDRPAAAADRGPPRPVLLLDPFDRRGERRQSGPGDDEPQIDRVRALVI